MNIKNILIIELSLVSLLLFGPYSLIVVPAIIYFTRKHNAHPSDRNQAESLDAGGAPSVTDKPDEKELPFTGGEIPRYKHHEALVSCYLGTLSKDSYTVIDNVTIPSPGGSTTNAQIDHVVVSRHGIFCIETKSHRGWIYCSENKEFWTQILPRSCNEFYSPSRQNFAHTQALKSLLSSRLKGAIVPIVVFTSADMVIKKGNINIGNIGHMLREIDRRRTLVYSRYEYERIVNMIQFANKADEITAYEHRDEIGKLVASLSA